MKHALSALLIAISVPTAAFASEYQLKPGNWQFQEGIGIGQKSAGQSQKQICVEADQTEADANWFIALAKPNDDCTSRLISHTNNQIRVDFACPMNGHTLKGPSTITLQSDLITIRNDLALDLPYAPLPMGQTKSVLHVSSSCN